MELIIDFYKGLDTLNLIIFWGIIIVIILLLIFSCILINKNKKLKKIVENNNNNKYEEELPIKNETPIKEENEEKIIEQPPEILPILKKTEEPTTENKNISRSIEIEKKFVAEEHVMEYNKESNKKADERNNSVNAENNHVVSPKPSIEMPTAPYQRNVLREMSLSQTSPIGINRPTKQEDKKNEIARDLEDSLNNKSIEEVSIKEETKIEQEKKIEKEIDNVIKKDLNNIDNNSTRKTEIKKESQSNESTFHKENKFERENPNSILEEKYNINRIEATAKELLSREIRTNENKQEKSSSEKYLEEVSRKLAEAEVPDEIERTNYELQQEEDAIISYKELMEKKDSIQTIDEEDAIISIEELMERNNHKQEKIEKKHQETKLYNISDEEENDNFINELKQFRNDL